MATWASFHPRLMVHVPGCTIPLANQELREAAARFFDMTRAWAEWLDPITIQDGNAEYDLDRPNGTRIVRLERARINGQDLSILPFRLVEPGMAGADSRDRQVLRFNTQPAAGSIVEVEASLAPDDTATGIPDHLYQQYATHIVDGAIGRLKLIQGQPFTDPVTAQAFTGRYEAAINTHMARVRKSNTASTPRSRPTWC